MNHEIRTPLNTILGLIQIMANKNNIPKEEQENFTIIQRNSNHLLILISQILDFSKIESVHARMNYCSFDLFHLLNEVNDMFDMKARQKGIIK